MTEQEAQRIINEHRTECPRFVRGGYSYDVRRDGRVDIYKAVGKSGLRWTWRHTVAADDSLIPRDVRERLA